MTKLEAALREREQCGVPTQLLLIGASATDVRTWANLWPEHAPHLRLVSLHMRSCTEEPHVTSPTPVPPPFKGTADQLGSNVSWVNWGALQSDGSLDASGRFHGVWLDERADITPPDLMRALRRHLWRGSWLQSAAPMSDALTRACLAQGWHLQPQPSAATEPTAREWPTAFAVDAVYLPRWPAPQATGAMPTSAMVIGAGLAGASVTAQLTSRGLHVDWIDAQLEPAQGASALPVGLLSRHPTAQPTPLSELTDIGLACTQATLQRLLPSGQGWQATPAHRIHDDRTRPDQSDPAWLIEPKALVQAWRAQALASGRLTEHWGCKVHRLQCQGGQWQALDAQGQVMAQASVVVVANAHQAGNLLPALAPALRAVAGQMSWAGLAPEDLPVADAVLRSHGVVSPAFESSRGRIWTVGSTYRRGVSQPQATEADHDANRACMARLCPEGLARFDQQRARGEMQAFVGVRCATPDRMPLLGAVPDADQVWPHRGGLAAVPRQPGLYAFTALGSRGLTLAAWGAETLADMVQSLPLPTRASFAHMCDPARRALHSGSSASNQKS